MGTFQSRFMSETSCCSLAQMWPMLAPGIEAFTKAAGYAMTLKLRNATVYTRLKGRPLAAISTEPVAAPGSITVQGQEAGSSSSSSLSGGAIAGIVAGSIAGVLVLAALAAFGMLRLRRGRQQKAADRKLGGGKPKAVHTHKTTGSDGSASRWEAALHKLLHRGCAARLGSCCSLWGWQASCMGGWHL